ncbi:hypothetical protein GALMADRAFT_146799 [Galerina marginata CBS 339.88]|uniref:Magnesium transporter NIPA-domain-containing protein n=1 Tax=Galerina marginata (strain CBS 339.88) TaxID=685588 RepID=A0A067SA50_GALM3|nr:hypothetical protein GALMADRAFT_146799 [Galerina marginata CBS 339.88]
MSTLSSSPTASAAAATTSAVTHTLSASHNLKIVGIILAITSGLLIGSSFVFKKKGLLRSQAGGEMGEGVAYLKSPLWWTGMSMMILGELCNFAAYAFVEAIVVTPLGALSVVICAILSSFFLNEKLSFFGWLGCTLCIVSSLADVMLLIQDSPLHFQSLAQSSLPSTPSITIIAFTALPCNLLSLHTFRPLFSTRGRHFLLNGCRYYPGPQEQTVGQITEFQKLFLAPGFLSFISVLIVTSLVIIFFFAPKYGKKSMLWYISVCSMIGGISVSVTTGLGAAIVQTAMGDNQFKHWFMYFLFGFVIITLLVEVYYLNVALALFNTAMVTPTYYVIFTFFSMVTTIVLFQGLEASATQIITLVMGFLVICLGITILQMSKVDPTKLSKLDRRSTILLQAARAQTETVDEKGFVGYEDPGMDTLRGSFGTVGSIIRARTVKRMSQMEGARGQSLRMRPPGAAAPYDGTASWMSQSGLPGGGSEVEGMKRHQLYDAPVPRDDASSFRAPSVHSQLVNKKPTIKFDSQEIVHSYSRPGQPQSPATHEHRQAIHGSMIVHDGYPPLPPLPDVSATSSSTSRDSAAPSAQVTEGNLLEMDSPEITRPTISTMQQQQTEPLLYRNAQDLMMPPFLKDSVAVHSAPPTMYRGFARPGAGQGTLARKDSRDIFDAEGASTGGATTRGTLLSFPSVTDSAPSEWDQDELKRLGGNDVKGGLAGKAREREREKPRTPKRYPKGLDDDDQEESERLWQKQNSVDEISGLPPPSGAGSIRLVQPKKNQI